MRKKINRVLSILLILSMFLSIMKPFTLGVRAEQDEANVTRTEHVNSNEAQTTHDEANKAQTVQNGVNVPQMAQEGVNRTQGTQNAANNTQTEQDGVNETQAGQETNYQTEITQNALYSTQTTQDVIYEPMATEYGIFNQFNYNNDQYYLDYAKNQPYYNTIGSFNKVIGSHPKLEPKTKYEYNLVGVLERYSWDFCYKNYDYSNLSTYGYLVEAGQLQYNFALTMRINKHSHGSLWWKESGMVYPYVVLYGTYTGTYDIRDGYDLRNEGTSTIRWGDEGGRVYNKITSPADFGIGYKTKRTMDCGCDGTYISDLVLTFADTNSVQFKKAYTCDVNGNAKSNNKSGEDVYLKVEFNEPIRFSDNQANHGDMQVKVMTDQNDILTAHLIKLKDNYLIFKIDNTNTTKALTLTTVDFSSFVKNDDDKWPLKEIFGTKWAGQSVDAGKYGANAEGFTVSKTLITDLAGNPLSTAGSANYSIGIQDSYLDGEAPKVREIVNVGKMYNDDINAEMGGTDNPSVNNAGVGDEITFTAKFNEKILVDGKIYENPTAFNGLKAKLNIKRNGSDEYVWLTSKSISMENSSEVNYKNGPSKGAYTTVTFETFIVENGMTCDDPDRTIAITDIIPVNESTIITDLCDNVYINEGTKNVNRDIKYLDSIAPAVKAKSGTEAHYTPTVVNQEGELIKLFYFTIEITDNETGTNSIKGSFKWTNGLNTTPYAFKYVVTSDTDVSDLSSIPWAEGVTNQSYSFDQVAAGNHVYIQLLDNVPYNLKDTTLIVTGKDYAGNKNTQYFNLNYTADCVAPSAELNSTVKNFNQATNTGVMTAKVKVSDDNSGLMRVYYAWVKDGSGAPAKDSDVWIPTGSFDSSNNKEVIVDAPTEEVPREVAFVGELYIKAVDIFGCTSIIKIGKLTYNLSEPRINLEYTDKPQEKASIKLEELDSDSAAIVMIKKPGTEDYYYVCVRDASTMGLSSDLFSSNYYAPAKGHNTTFDNNLYAWALYKVTKGEYGYDFEYQDNNNASDPNLLYITQGHYYGDVEITILTGRTDVLVKNIEAPNDIEGAYENEYGTYAFKYKSVKKGVELYSDTHRWIISAGTEAYPVYEQHITLKAAYSYALNIHTASMELASSHNTSHYVRSSDTIGTPTEGLYFNPDDKSTYNLSTLEGVTFKINIENRLMPEWGAADIDFSKSCLNVIRTEDENGNDTGGEVVLSIKLDEQQKTEQLITLPAYNYPSGTYMLELKIVSLAVGQVLTFRKYDIGTRIYVDATKASEKFGFAGYEQVFSNPDYGIKETNEYYCGPISGVSDASDYTSNETDVIYIPVNSELCTELSQRLYFTVDDVPDNKFGVRAIKAWNVTDGVDANESKQRAVWYNANAKDRLDTTISISYYYARYVDSPSDVLNAYGTIYGFGYLPLIKNTENVIAYQVINANGEVSAIKYVHIYPIETKVSGTVSITDTNGSFVKEGKLTFTPDPNQSMKDVKVYVYDYNYDNETGKTVDITDNYDLYNNSYYYTLTQSGKHLYYVYTLDTKIYPSGKSGNYTLMGSNFWYYTDSGAPALVTSYNENIGDGKYKTTFVFNEESLRVFDGNSLQGPTVTLKLNFDSDYMKALGMEDSSESTYFTLNIPVPIKGDTVTTVYEANESNLYGIYKVDVMVDWNKDPYQFSVIVYGVAKYDSTLQEGQDVTHTIYATLTDQHGYESATAGVSISAKNIKPQYVDGYYGEYYLDDGGPRNGFVAYFNTPVMVKKSLGTNNPSPYSETKGGELPVFGDGIYTIIFYDIFGTPWIQEITLENVFREYSLRILVSETSDTKEPVNVTIVAEHPEEISFMIWNLNKEIPITDKVKEITITVDENTNFAINFFNNDNINPVKDNYLSINNILAGYPTATLYWYYTEFMSNTLPEGVTQTSGPVLVWYKANREAMPIDGTGESYTFYPGTTTTSYTFKFQDSAGNQGSITATLPIATVEPPQPTPDTTAPKYGLSVYGKIGGIYQQVSYYSSTSPISMLETAIQEAGYVQGYYFDIDVIEDSPYKIILLPDKDADISSVTYSGSVSEAIDGVDLSGRTLTVSGAAEFTVVIVDKSDNKTAFSMKLGKYLDNTKPTAEFKQEYKSLYSLYQYISLSDKSDTGDDTGIVELVSPTGLSKVTDSASPYYGQYYYLFTDNQTLIITYKDMAGNRNSSAITVDNLDMSPAEATVVWSPPYYDGIEEADPSLSPITPTNNNVTATVSYSKPIASVTAYIYIYSNDKYQWVKVIDDRYNNLFELKTSSDTVVVTFKKGNLDILLEAMAVNGKKTKTTLYLGDIIDKSAPTVYDEVNYKYNTGFENGMPYAAVITLTPDEDVYCFESATPDILIKAGSSISFTVFNPGTYTYHFTDAAGNVTTKTVKVDKDIDRTAPNITINKEDGTVTSGKVTVLVSMDEDGILAVTGADKITVFKENVTKDEQRQIYIDNNGSYEVTAWDKAGNKTVTVFTVGNIDRSAPAITLSPATVSIREGSDADALKLILDQGFLVSDNVSKDTVITKYYDASGVDLDKPGIYTVTYTAMDEAGNKATATRYVRVYSKDELDVLINGKKTYKGETIAVGSRTMTISVNNPAGQEPYTIYISSGIKTEGQMKYTSTIIKPDENGSFTVQSRGFYTLYIVTQSRQTYLTTIYVEQ